MDDTRRQLIVILKRFAPWVDEYPEPVLMQTDIREIGLDSMSIVWMIFELEEFFEITFTDELLTYDVFKTPGTIENAVRDLRQTR